MSCGLYHQVWINRELLKKVGILEIEQVGCFSLGTIKKSIGSGVQCAS